MRAADYTFTITDRDAARGGGSARDRALDGARDAGLRRGRDGRLRDHRGKVVSEAPESSHVPRLRPTAGLKGARGRVAFTDALLGGGIAGSVAVDALDGARGFNSGVRDRYTDDPDLPYAERARRRAKANKAAQTAGRVAGKAASGIAGKTALAAVASRAFGQTLSSIARGAVNVGIAAAGARAADEALGEVITRQRTDPSFIRRKSDYLYEGAAAGVRSLGRSAVEIGIGGLPRLGIETTGGTFASIIQIARGRGIKTPQENKDALNKTLNRILFDVQKALGLDPAETEEMRQRKEANVAYAAMAAEVDRTAASARARIRTQTGARLFELGLDFGTAEAVFRENERRVETLMAERVRLEKQRRNDELNTQLSEKQGG